jgi:hypothetical protein
MKAYKVSGGIAPPILHLSTGWRSEDNTTFLPIYPRRKSSDTQVIGGWVDPRASPDVVEMRKNLFPLSGIEPEPTRQ